ncbi:MAG: heavy-metal-associated domain-containing protein [Candidatus Thorarchaeota archaeon]
MNNQITKTRRKHLSIEISGMNCPRCAGRIQNILLNQEGVLGATVSLQNAEAVVEYEEGRVNRNSLERAVESLGYKVVR